MPSDDASMRGRARTHTHTHTHVGYIIVYVCFICMHNCTCMYYHWRRLVNNIGWANQNIGGQKAVKSDKCMRISQLWGAYARAAPKSLRLCVCLLVHCMMNFRSSDNNGIEIVCSLSVSISQYFL